ncbi:MAG TPA: radical SAM protein [Terriglobia bacterium]|nr:radical SAM protein [Terriglobia bacterium]
MNKVALKRKARFIRTRVRELRMISRALRSSRHPVLAHIIPTRRCNLSCAYCNEYDNFSKPLPPETMCRRLDRLADLGTSIITISGGEPLLHPQLEDIIRHIRLRGMIAGMITNGYLLTQARIESLNDAGLEHLQISIDNVKPDDISKKSLKVLDQKLKLLAEHAVFQVNINSVLGSAVNDPEDALTVARRAIELGFTSTVGVIHDHAGQFRPLSAQQQKIFTTIMSMGKSSYSRFNRHQKYVAQGIPRDWRCRAGSRYLYICEDGLVHYCSQQRGYPGIPLENYTPQHLDHEYHTIKSCAPRCTIQCVQHIALLDNWRHPQTLPGFEKPIEPVEELQTTVPES